MKEEENAVAQSLDQSRNNAGRGVRIRKGYYYYYLFGLSVILIGLL